MFLEWLMNNCEAAAKWKPDTSVRGMLEGCMSFANVSDCHVAGPSLTRRAMVDVSRLLPLSLSIRSVHNQDVRGKFFHHSLFQTIFFGSQAAEFRRFRRLWKFAEIADWLARTRRR